MTTISRPLVALAGAVAAAAFLTGCGGDTEKPATPATSTTTTTKTTTSPTTTVSLPEPAPEPVPEQPADEDAGDGGFVSGGPGDPVAESPGLAEDCAAGTAAASTCSYWGYPFGTSAGQGKTISHCGDATMQPGTTFYTDGTTGWTQYCQDQMTG